MNAFDSLSPEIQDHLRQIAKTSGLAPTEDSHERMAAAWLEKLDIFEKAVKDNKLVEVAFFGRAEERGALVLTFSGSLLNVGPLVDGARRCEYASIGMRADVPPTATDESSELAADLELEEPAQFVKGPIKTSSPLYKIAVAKDELEPNDEEALLTQVTQELAEDFIEVNKTLIG
ncbi:MAG: hypothetical protein E4H20_02515 [Spirochaetales bacterium]|nr:MAG: hypothetical protein E4H20_02515 [Spirochaetales bacterium]